LAGFQRRLKDFDKRGIKIIAGSVDSLDNARKTVTQEKVTYPVAYGLDAREFAKATGAFYNDELGYLNGTAFIVRPNGKVAGALYSTGKIGRYNATECLGMIDYWMKPKEKYAQEESNPQPSDP
jgi:alkyl hydroperoxide reductase subunit AhpC